MFVERQAPMSSDKHKQEKVNGYVKEFDWFLKQTIIHKCSDVLKGYAVNLRRDSGLIFLDDLDTLSGGDPSKDFEKVRVVLGDTILMVEDEKLADAVALLSDRYKQVLDLAIFDEKSNRAIADLMQLKEKTIRNYKSNALAILRKCLEGESDNE